jgi:hypothetical protein
MCTTCGHSRVFHDIGTGNGVPIGQDYCDDRHADSCNCRGFQSRPPRELYARATINRGEFTHEPAVEFHGGDDYDDVVAKLEACAEIEIPPDPIAASLEIGAAIAALWPGRAYFVESWQTGRRGFAQVFQPYGLPRNQ